MLTLPPPPFPLRVCPSWLCFFVRFAHFLPVQSVQKTTWYRCLLSVLHFNRMNSIGMFAWHHKQTALPVSAFSFFFASASFFFSSASAFLSFLLGCLALSPPVFGGLTHRASAARNSSQQTMWVRQGVKATKLQPNALAHARRQRKWRLEILYYFLLFFYTSISGLLVPCYQTISSLAPGTSKSFSYLWNEWFSDSLDFAGSAEVSNSAWIIPREFNRNMFFLEFVPRIPKPPLPPELRGPRNNSHNIVYIYILFHVYLLVSNFESNNSSEIVCPDPDTSYFPSYLCFLVFKPPFPPKTCGLEKQGLFIFHVWQSTETCFFCFFVSFSNLKTRDECDYSSLFVCQIQSIRRKEQTSQRSMEK